MLVVNDPDRIVLKMVEPKNRPAVSRNHRVGWTFNQSLKASTIGRGFRANVWIEIDGKKLWNAQLVIAHSTAQIKAISPASVRNRATFGIST